MLHRDGFALGDHTFTHANLAALPSWEAQLQISPTESAIAGITGMRPRLVRPPYSSTTDAVTPAEEARGEPWRPRVMSSPSPITTLRTGTPRRVDDRLATLSPNPPSGTASAESC